MTVSQAIFKAYDVRGLYPSELDETTARAIGGAFVAYLDAKRIVVSRDMRVSSPSLAKAFIEGARAQGAGRRRLRHVRHRHDVFSRRERRFRRRRANYGVT